MTKYEKWYWRIVGALEQQQRAKGGEDYFESHHIYPRGLFGATDNNFTVLVTPREHYVLHLLLSKFTPLSFPMFWTKGDSREFSVARKLKSESMKGEKHHLYGRGHSKETKEAMRINPNVINSVRGKKAINNGVSQKFIDIKTELVPEGWELGRLPLSEETKLKMSRVDPNIRAVNKGRKFPTVGSTCPICGKTTTSKSGMAQHVRRSHQLPTYRYGDPI